MLALLRWLIGATILVSLIIFAVSNRQDVSLVIHPLHDPYTVPLYIIVLLMTAIGFIIGALMVWFSGAKIRKENRKNRKTIERLEEELAIDNQSASSKIPDNELFLPVTKAHKA